MRFYGRLLASTHATVVTVSHFTHTCPPCSVANLQAIQAEHCVMKQSTRYYCTCARPLSLQATCHCQQTDLQEERLVARTGSCVQHTSRCLIAILCGILCIVIQRVADGGLGVEMVCRNHKAPCAGTAVCVSDVT